MAKVVLNGEEFSVSRAKFKTWINLEEIRESVSKAVEMDDIDRIADLIILYISTALNVNSEVINGLPWKEVASAYSISVMENNNIRLLPFMKFSKKNQEDEQEIWHYPGYLWYSYVNKFADKYKWSLEYISNLDVDDAFSLIQEMLVSDQINREWEWALSEKSSGYDEATKKSRFIELPRPDWMKPIPKPPKKVKIPKFMLPVGNIVRYTNRQDAVH